MDKKFITGLFTLFFISLFPIKGQTAIHRNLDTEIKNFEHNVMEVQNSISHNSYDSFNLIPDTIPDSWEVHSKGIGRILNYIQAEMALSYLQNHDVDNASKYYYLSYKNGNVSLENYFSETLNAREPFTKDTIKEGLINYLRTHLHS